MPNSNQSAGSVSSTAVRDHENRPVRDEYRRRFLKILGVTTTGVAGLSLSEAVVAADGSDDPTFAEAGAAIRDDVADALDTEFITETQGELAEAAGRLPEIPEKGYPDERRDDYSNVAVPGFELLDHLEAAGVFDSTTEHLPDYDVEFVDNTLQEVLVSEHFVGSLTDLGLTEDEAADLLATVAGRAEELSGYHWVGNEDHERIDWEVDPQTDSMTLLSSDGGLVWIDDLDDHIYEQTILITEEMLYEAAWYAHAIATGFYLVSEASRVIAAGEDVSDAEIGAAYSLAFAVESIAQNLLCEDVYWITHSMRRDMDDQPLV